MAPTTVPLFLRLSLLLGLLALSATARPGRHFHPCKTLIFFTTTTTTTTTDNNPNNPFSQNPNFPIPDPNHPRFLTFFFTEVRELPSYETLIVDHAISSSSASGSASAAGDIEKRPFPSGYYPSAGASFRDRSKEVLGAVGALLFGVGCGALTAATMYLFWSLFSPSRFEFRESDDEFDVDDNDDDDLKPKMGYVAIPAEAPLKPAKEMV